MQSDVRRYNRIEAGKLRHKAGCLNLGVSVGDSVSHRAAGLSSLNTANFLSV